MTTVLENLKARHVDLALHTVWIDEIERVATFPLWNLSGKLAGYQRYRPDQDKHRDNDPKMSRYYTYKKERALAVWGMESWYLTNTLYVTEGVFDAARITAKGCSAIATLSNDLDDTTREWLYIVKATRRVVTICDNDEAGRKLAKFGHASHTVEQYKDLGDADNSYINNLLATYT
jgi:hypothetical protein